MSMKDDWQPELPGPMERAELEKESRRVTKQIMVCGASFVLLVLGAIALILYAPMVACFLAATSGLTLVITLFICTLGKCPRCFNKLERHERHPNAYVCPKCQYIKVCD